MATLYALQRKLKSVRVVALIRNVGDCLGRRGKGRHTHRRKANRISQDYVGTYLSMKDSLQTTGQTEYKCPNCCFSSRVDVENRICYCRRMKKWVKGKLIVCHYFRSRIPGMFL